MAFLIFGPMFNFKLPFLYSSLLKKRAVVALGVGSYAHRDRSIGRVKFPVFEIVGWAPKDGGGPAPAVPTALTAPPPSTPKTAAASSPRF